MVCLRVLMLLPQVCCATSSVSGILSSLKVFIDDSTWLRLAYPAPVHVCVTPENSLALHSQSCHRSLSMDCDADMGLG
jgi:hypothetical protein